MLLKKHGIWYDRPRTIFLLNILLTFFFYKNDVISNFWHAFLCHGRYLIYLKPSDYYLLDLITHFMYFAHVNCSKKSTDFKYFLCQFYLIIVNIENTYETHLVKRKLEFASLVRGRKSIIIVHSKHQSFVECIAENKTEIKFKRTKVSPLPKSIKDKYLITKLVWLLIKKNSKVNLGRICK